MRECALRRAKFRCQLCNSEDRLNVHHRKYPKTLGNEPMSDLIVLCKPCHGHFHGKEVEGQTKYKNNEVLGKTTQHKGKYHIWSKYTVTNDFSAICDYNITRNRVDIFEPKPGDTLCKNCKIRRAQ